MSNEFQFEIDFRTSKATAIAGGDSQRINRSACHALNRSRARGVLEASSQTPPGQSVSADVWATTFTERAEEWDVPIVDLENLGLYHDSDGFISSEFLSALPTGAEAKPYADFEQKVVYKLFDLRADGSVGKKLIFKPRSQGFEIDVSDATWRDTILKISVLNHAGGLPTEFVGLASTGDYVIVKQPLAYPYENFLRDRQIAEDLMRGIKPVGGELRQHLFVTYSDDEFWLVGDLHERNIMRDPQGHPTIIDALIGRVTPLAQRELSWLRKACEDAKSFRETGTKPTNPFLDVEDDDL